MDKQEMQKEAVLRVTGATKTFGGVMVLDNVELTLYAGEVHVLIGENGAGKSTLIKIISGAYIPNAGRIEMAGETVEIGSPIDAIRAGISVVYQELNLVDTLSAYENIFLYDQIVRKRGFVNVLDKQVMIEKSKELLASIGADIDVTVPIRTLSIAQRQMIEIAKALRMNSKVVIFDEPSAVLTEVEVEKLFEVIERLKKKGISICYISHRMDEIMRIGDRITVLRDGKRIGCKSIREENVTIDDIIKMMVGRELSQQYPKTEFTRGEELLRVEHLSCGNYFNDVSFSLYSGEILCFSGLVGAGRSEVAKTIFGALPKTDGKIFLQGEEMKVKSPDEAIALGIALVPEDRKDEGLFLSASLYSNLVVASVKNFTKHHMMQFGRIKEVCREIGKKLRLNTDNFNLKAGNLSGGNQQKIALGKWMIANPKLIILDEPTRGVDVGAKAEVYRLINELVEEGIGVIMISSDLPEVLGMSDRVIVMHEGRVTGTLDRKEASQVSIMKLATM